MPKEAKRKPASAESKRERSGDAPPRPSGAQVLSLLKGMILLCFVAAVVWGYLRTRGHVEKHVAFGRMPPTVVLKDRPAWMSDGLAQKITRIAAPEVAHSAFDHRLLV